MIFCNSETISVQCVFVDVWFSVSWFVVQLDQSSDPQGQLSCLIEWIRNTSYFVLFKSAHADWMHLPLFLVAENDPIVSSVQVQCEITQWFISGKGCSHEIGTWFLFQSQSFKASSSVLSHPPSLYYCVIKCLWKADSFLGDLSRFLMRHLLFPMRVELLTSGATCLLLFLPDQATKCKAFSSNNTSPDIHRQEDRIDPCLPYSLCPPPFPPTVPVLPFSLNRLFFVFPPIASSLFLCPSVALPLSLSLWGVY